MFFFFNDTATTEIYTLSLHDALPISEGCPFCPGSGRVPGDYDVHIYANDFPTLRKDRSEEHTSELQSLTNLVCRLLLEKKKKIKKKKKPAITSKKHIIHGVTKPVNCI